jgi:hypothetical protein
MICYCNSPGVEEETNLDPGIRSTPSCSASLASPPSCSASASSSVQASKFMHPNSSTKHPNLLTALYKQPFHSMHFHRGIPLLDYHVRTSTPARRGGGLSCATVADGGLRQGSPASGVHDREGHCRQGTLLHGEQAGLGPEKVLVSGQRRTTVKEALHAEEMPCCCRGDARQWRSTQWPFYCGGDTRRRWSTRQPHSLGMDAGRQQQALGSSGEAAASGGTTAHV